MHEFVTYDGARFAPVEELQAQLVLHALAKRSQLQVLCGYAPNADVSSVLAVAKWHIHEDNMVRPSVVRNKPRGSPI